MNWCLPAPADLLEEALEGLGSGGPDCTCLGRYHALWSVLKAAGVHRGLYTEVPLLASVLSPRLARGGHVLVAGAADGASLTLMASCLGPAPVRFTVVDRCPLPLHRVVRVAAERGLSVTPRLGDLGDDARIGAWDLAFLHYTLSFADAPGRRAVLDALVRGLAKDGVIVCAVKAVTLEDSSQDGWLQALRPRIAELLADHPTERAEVERWLPDYAEDRMRRNRLQPDPDAVAADMEAVGLRVLERHGTARQAWSESPENPVKERQRSVLLVAGR